MKVQKISFTGGVKIPSNQPKKYLYNEVLDLVREHHLPATFERDKIVLPSVNEKIKEILNKLGILFSNIDKK